MKQLIKEWRVFTEAWKADETEIYPGEEELGRLSRGITEKKKEVAYCEPGNPYFDKEGRFTSPEKAAGSMSSGYWGTGRPGGCRRGKMARKQANKSTQITKHPCGRKTKTGGKAQYRCHDGKKLWEADGEGYVRVKEEDITRYMLEVLEDIVVKLGGAEDLIVGETSAISSKDKKTGHYCNKHGYQSYKQFLKAINNLKQATDGKMGVKPKA